MRALISILTLLFTGIVLSQECQKHEWVRSGIRTQGGGWIWFLGQGSGSESPKAFFRAEGQALDRLVKECGGIHQEVKFIERCQEKKGKKIVAYARASVKQGFCNEFKYGKGSKTAKNKALHKRHNQYLEQLSHSLELDLDGCNDRSSNKCSIYSIEERSKKNLIRAEGIAFFGCRKNDLLSCYEYALIKSLNGTEFYASAKVACLLGGAELCFRRAVEEIGAKNSKLGEYYMHLACHDDFFKACSYLARLKKESGKTKDAMNYFMMSCLDQDTEACRDGAKLAKNETDEDLENKFKRRGCQLGVENFCKELGIVKDSLNPSEKNYINDKTGNSIELLKL